MNFFQLLNDFFNKIEHMSHILSNALFERTESLE
jgi:hypothetical protein